MKEDNSANCVAEKLVLQSAIRNESRAAVPSPWAKYSSRTAGTMAPESGRSSTARPK
jgi:hypothetical protein